jgi:hypothetical protein
MQWSRVGAETMVEQRCVALYVHAARGSKILRHMGEVKSRFMYDMQFVESHDRDVIPYVGVRQHACIYIAT